MHTRQALGIIRLVLGAIILGAILYQLLEGMGRPQFSIINFFSFFTIQSNLLAGFLFIITGFGALANKRSRFFASLRGATTLYMVTTGLVYVLLLAGLEASLQTTVPWVNFVLHYFAPMAVLISWLIDLPPFRLGIKHALLWLLFPIAYLIYSLVRGAFTGWYPYPFLDPTEQGNTDVAITCLIIALTMFLLSWGISNISRAKPQLSNYL